MTAATENTGRDQQAPTKWLMLRVLAVAVLSLQILGLLVYKQSLRVPILKLLCLCYFLRPPSIRLVFHQGRALWVSGIWVYSLGSVLRVLTKVCWVSD